MTQKEALMHALEFVQSPFSDNIENMKADRAFFICVWLEDKNWHTEMRVLLKRTRNTAYLKTAFKALEANEHEATKIDDAARLLNHIFGWGFALAEWNAIAGTPLIEELWKIINLKQYT